jgi:hypothetical protein
MFAIYKECLLVQDVSFTKLLMNAMELSTLSQNFEKGYRNIFIGSI